MKKVIKKTVVKKPVLKKAQLGAEVSPMVSDGSKYYKSRRGIRPDKEISEKKYNNKRYRMTKSAENYDYDSVNNPESSYTLYDTSGEKKVIVPANKTMTYTKGKGIGKGKSIKEVRPIEKQKKGGAMKKVVKKSLAKAGLGKVVKAVGKSIAKEVKPSSYNPYRKATPVKDVAKGAGVVGAYGAGAYGYLTNEQAKANKAKVEANKTKVEANKAKVAANAAKYKKAGGNVKSKKK